MTNSEHGGAAARSRAFLWHLATFGWVMLLLLVIDVVLTGTDDLFIHWVAAIWGIILGVHLVDAFLLGGFLGFHARGCGPWDHHRRRDEGQTTT